MQLILEGYQMPRTKRVPSSVRPEIAKAQAVDHKMSFSTYFCDPWGNRFEVTTYDHDFVSAQLQ